MKAIMDDSRLNNITAIAGFLKSSQRLVLNLDAIEDKYCFLDETIDRFRYVGLKRKDKQILLAYLKKITGYKKAQLLRLVKRAVSGELKRKKYQRVNSHRVYLLADIKLLEKTDELHLRLNSLATKEILRREWEVYGHDQFQNIARISSSHINNLRNNPVYKNYWSNGTKSREVRIGKTEPPQNNNLPGSIRVDTVHQRDVFHVNAVDEITQWEIVVCVQQISERFLAPALELLLTQFPFTIFNFHSDRGGEFVNSIVAQILNKLLIQQTKSRSRHCNDNALVETKNGSVIRKNMGYWHINCNLANRINEYYLNFFNIYLNFHRPCLFLTETEIGNQGKRRRIYGEVKTPYTKLKGVYRQTKKNFLTPVASFEKLDKIEKEYSDNEFAEILRKEERKIFAENIRLKNNGSR